ncbi:hypothetical protein L218DRAFT_968292 [Marasmius fiardii PR-910]|nr:hypothetical protein L218DRAFT_968292 [Marasmius fiardii PR-910]
MAVKSHFRTITTPHNGPVLLPLGLEDSKISKSQEVEIIRRKRSTGSQRALNDLNLNNVDEQEENRNRLMCMCHFPGSVEAAPISMNQRRITKTKTRRGTERQIGIGWTDFKDCLWDHLKQENGPFPSAALLIRRRTIADRRLIRSIKGTTSPTNNTWSDTGSERRQKQICLTDRARGGQITP